MSQRLASALAVVALLFATSACGGEASGGSAARTYGGPLEDPGWRQGAALTTVLRPPKPGGKVIAGMAVVTNRSEEPAVIERIALVGPSRNVRVAGFYTADSTRSFWAGDEYSWPPPPGEYGNVRPARGTRVPAAGAPGADLGVEILVVLDLPRRGRYTFRAVRVDYRVGERRHWIESPNSYAICTPRTMKCPDSPPYRSRHHR